MKRYTVILVVLALVGFASQAFGEVTSETVEWTPPPDCGAPYVESMDECSLCHLADSGGSAPVTSLLESAEADSLTYKTIVSSDQRIMAEIPAETVQPNQEFNHFVSVTPYIMTYQYGYAYGSTFHTLDYKWPWGSTDLNYSYMDTSLSVPGEYKYKVRIIHCDSGAPVCGHGWVQTTLKWTVTVGDDVCSIPAIPYLSQCDPAWGGSEYDGTTNVDTICQVGCALTSATMVVRRYGINQVNVSGTQGGEELVNPGNVNRFCNEHYEKEDGVTMNGYTRNGSIRWLWMTYLAETVPVNPQIIYESTLAGNAPTSETGNCIYARSNTSGDDTCSIYNRRINDSICDGKPMILRVRSRSNSNKTHFIVAQNQKSVGNTETLGILDPSCDPEPEDNEECRTLWAGFSNIFTGIRTFAGSTEGSDPTRLVVYLGSPAHLLITDTLGNMTGWDPISESFVREIPTSNYLDERIESEEPEWVAYVEKPQTGPYEIKVVGTGDGPFSIEVLSMDSGYTTNGIHRFEGNISTGREYTYEVNYSPDPQAKTTTDAKTYLFGGFKPPLDQNQPKLFKLNRTIPIKFSVARSDSGAHDDILANLTIQKVSNDVPVGEPIEPEVSGEANTDNLFRYDFLDDQYIYNLSTWNLTIGTWTVLVTLDDGSVQEIRFGLK